MEMNAIILNSSEWIGVIAVILLLTLSRRFATRPVAFKYLRREIILSSILAVVLIAAAFYANLALKLPTLPDGEAHVGGQLLWTVAILLPVVLLLVIRRQPLLSVGLSRPSMTLGLMLGAALALITIFLRGKVYSLLDGVSAAEFNYLIISLVRWQGRSSSGVSSSCGLPPGWAGPAAGWSPPWLISCSACRSFG
jgi:hypothetical protein